MGFGIRKYISSKIHDRRERLKARQPFEEAELENIKEERKALKTRATIRSEKASLRKEQFAGSFVGRAISGAKKIQKQSRARTKSTKSRARTESTKHEINPAFSLGTSKKKKGIFD